MKQYTYSAPLEIYDTNPSTLKTITANYTGLPTIWVSVDKQTNKIINFVSDGTLSEPGEKETIKYYLLSQENPNHIIAMDMLDNCKGRINTNNSDELIHTFANGFKIRYIRPEDPDALHTFDRDNLVIDSAGVITYPWRPPHITKEMFNAGVLGYIEYVNNELNTLGVSGSISKKAAYEKVLEVLIWVRDNTENIKPWKINLPTLETFT